MKAIKVLCFLMLWTIVGCSSSFQYFEHPETQNYQGYWEPELPGDVFEEHPDLIDAGILFVPRVKELAWEPDHRASIFLYTQKRARIKVDRIAISCDQPEASASLEINKTVEISAIDKHSGLFRGEVPAIFEGAKGASDVLAARQVTMAIHYRVLPSGGQKEKRFVLRKKVKLGRALSDIFAAA